jgi:hypothetical protein
MNAETPEDDHIARRRREKVAREHFLTELFGAEEWQDRMAPQPVEDMASLLGEHAAQLRNVARYFLGYAICDDLSIQGSACAAVIVNKVIRTNIAIAQALREDAEENRKTVDGVAVTVEPQD